MKAFINIFINQARIFFRDRITFLLTLFLPLLLGLFFSLIFNSFQAGTIKITIVNDDKEQASQLMVQGIIKEGSNDQLQMIEAPAQDAAIQELKAGKTQAVIVFPKGTSESMSSGKALELPVYFDSTKMESAGIARNVTEILVSKINMNINQIPEIFKVNPVSITNAQFSLAQFFLPNFLAISILWLSIFATAMPLVKQREQKILLRIGTTPVSKMLFMGANTLWRLSIGILQSLLFLIVAVFALKIDILRIWPTFLLAIFLGNLTFTTMGYMIAAISKTTQSAEAISQLFNFVFMFLSGVFFTSDMLPEFVNAIAYAIPLTYLADMFRQVMVGYKGLVPLWIDFVVLAGCGLLFTGISIKAWRWN